MNPLWRTAPLALLRQPAVFGAIALGSLLVALAAASSPLFTTAAGSATLQGKLDEITAFGAGVELRREDFIASGPAPGDRALRSRFGALPSVESPVVTTVTGPVTAQRAGSPAPESVSVRLMARTGALDRVVRVAGGEGAGLWLADSVARALGIGPGGTLLLEADSGPDGQARSARARVAGVYRLLSDAPASGYWVNFAADIYPADPDEPPPPSFAIGDREQVLALATALGGGPVEHHWEFPLDPRGLTLPEARALERRFAAVEDELLSGDSMLARELGCRTAATATPARCSFRSSLSVAITLADRNIDAVSPPARLLATAGMLIALAVVAAAGVFLVARRRVEARLLFAHGRAGAWFAGRTAVEALLPIVLGGAAGFGLALLLVSVLESRGTVDREGLVAGAAAAGAGVAVALALLSAVAAGAFLRQYETGLRSGRSLRWVPWELVPLGLAAYLYLEVRGGGGLVEGGSSGIAHPSVAVFLLPLLLAAGIAGLAARLLRAGLRRLGPRAVGLPPPLYLAVRRLAAARGLAVVLVCGCAVALAAFFYAQALVATLESAVLLKAHVAKGGDAQGMIDYADDLPEAFPFPLTKVTVRTSGAAVGGFDGPEVDLMAIDPATFASVAAWEPSWGPQPAELARRLARFGGPELPVVVTGAGLSGQPLYIGGALVAAEELAVVEAFPGMSSQRPVVVTTYEAIERVAELAGIGNPLRQPSAATLVWGKGPPVQVAQALGESPLRPYYLQTTEGFVRDPDVEAETRTFSFLRALGIAAGLLAVVGLVLYLQARQRRTVVAAGLSKRMGLGGRSQALALSLELGVIFLVSVGVALAVALTAARLVAAEVDPLAAFPPGPLFRAPLDVIWIALPVLGVVAVIGGALASRAAARADFAEVMRLGE